MVNRPRGTRDFGPEEMATRRWAEGVLRDVAGRFGYREVSTPTFEEAELFVARSGQGILDEIYWFEDKGGRKLALRPELTAPTMRFYASDLSRSPKPLKIFYYGPCFRYERPQAGRYREFYQFGVEMIGPATPESTAELLALACSCFDNLGLKNYVMRVGNIAVLQSFAAKLGIDGEERDAVMRLIDKGDFDAVDKTLVEKGADPDVVMKLIQVIQVSGGRDAVKAATPLVEGVEGAAEALSNLEETLQALLALGYSNVRVDLGIARGLDYYDGMVFEVDAPALGAEKQVCGGGQYSLAHLFGAQEVPTQGFGLGFDRALLALEKEGFKPATPGLDVFVIPMGDKARAAALELVSELRRKGARCDIDLMRRGVGKSLKLANSLGAEVAAILGDDELANGTITVKNMSTGEQGTVPLEEFYDMV